MTMDGGAVKLNHSLILIAGYNDLDIARRDFKDLDKRIKKGTMEIRGAALVTKDADGTPRVIEAANRHGRMGAGWGAGVGLLLGLFAPPMLLAVVVGATAGGLVGAFAEHELRIGLKHEIGQALEAGTGVVVAVVGPDSQLPVERILKGSPTISVVTMDESTIHSLDKAVTEEMMKIDEGESPHQPS